jgi:hypothetical protein
MGPPKYLFYTEAHRIAHALALFFSAELGGGAPIGEVAAAAS